MPVGTQEGIGGEACMLVAYMRGEGKRGLCKAQGMKKRGVLFLSPPCWACAYPSGRHMAGKGRNTQERKKVCCCRSEEGFMLSLSQREGRVGSHVCVCICKRGEA